MSDLATLALAIDTRPAVEATTALDRMAEAATRGESRVKQIAMASDALVAALNRNTAATSALTSRMDEADRANARVSASMKGVDRASADAASSLGDLATGYGQTSTAAVNAARATDSVSAATTKHVSASAQSTTATARATAAHNDNARAVGLSSNELKNLGFQLNDVTTMALSGASAFQIAATQGGQLFQIAQSAGGGVRGLFTQAGEAASAMASRIGLVGAGFGALAIGIATATTAAVMFRNEQKELDRTTFGAGRASGASLYDLQSSAMEAAASGRTSGSQARDVVGALNATGRVNPGVYADVAKNMEDLSKLMGTDVPTATETVAGSLAKGISGFDRLNETLGLGGAAMRENLKDLYESGRGFEAQRIIVDALAGRIKEFKREVGEPGYLSRVFGAINRGFGQNTSDEMSGIGSVFRRRTTEESLASARQALTNGQAQVAAGLAPASSLDAARANVEKMEAAVAATARQGREAKTALTSLTVQPLVDSLNPAQKRINDLRTTAEGIDTYLKDGGDKLDQNGTARRTMEGLREQARQLADDLSRGGTALAEGLRNAQFNLRTVGFTDTGRTAATARERAENDIKSLSTQNLEPSVREAQIRTINERLTVELEKLQRESALAANAAGGALSRLSPEVQAQFLRAGADPRYARIPVGIAAAITAPESGGNLDVGYSRALGENGKRSSAFGLGQITRGTAEEAARSGYLPPGYDRTNRDTMAEGIMGVLSMKLAQNGGSLDKAIMAYRGSRDPQVNLRYLAEVKRNAGEAGDATVGGQARDVDALTRAQREAGQSVETLTRYYGRNGAALEAAQQQQQKYAELIARGIPAQEAANIAYGGLIAKTADFTRQAQSVRFDRDDEFARDQLGRTRSDQQAYATARYRYGDTDSAEARAAIETTRLTAGIGDARNTFNDVFGSVVQNLRRGASAATIATDAFGRFADKILNNALDKVASGFANGITGSTSTGGILKFLGFDGGGYTGPGGRLEPAGIVHRGEVVFSQDDVRRWGGAPAVDAMRRGGRGYSDGGIVGPGRYGPSGSPSPGSASSSSAQPMNLQVVVNKAPSQPTITEAPDGRGGRKVEITFDEAIAGAAGRSGSRTRQALGRNPLVST